MTTDRIRAAVEALVTALVDAARAPQPEPAAEYLTTAAAATVASVGEATIRLRDAQATDRCEAAITDAYHNLLANLRTVVALAAAESRGGAR